MVQRYNLMFPENGDDGVVGVIDSEFGRFVRHADYTALERERDELIGGLVRRVQKVQGLEKDNALLRKQLEVIKDDYLADKIAVDCHDKNHDDRWCPTCNARDIGIDEYRNAVNKAMELKEGE